MMSWTTWLRRQGAGVGWLRRRRRRAPRPRVWLEIALITLGYWAYDAVHDVASLSHEHAMADSRALYHAEHVVGLAHEHALNTTFANLGWVTVVGNYWYAILHLGVTATTLTWLYAFRPRHYRSGRSLLVGMSLVAFAVFWVFPVAPPRLLPGAGFIDTLAVHHTFGSYETGSLAGAADLYAAMPSLHVAWALWVAVMVRRAAVTPWLRRAAFAYPLLTAVDVLATGNHYVLDVLGGLLLVVVCAGAQQLWRRWHRYAEPAIPVDGGRRLEEPDDDDSLDVEQVA